MTTMARPATTGASNVAVTPSTSQQKQESSSFQKFSSEMSSLINLPEKKFDKDDNHNLKEVKPVRRNRRKESDILALCSTRNLI